MTTPLPSIGARRRLARDVARVGTAVSAVMLVAGIAVSFGPGREAAAAATNAGAVEVVVPPGTPSAGQPLAAGGSATTFALTPPVGAACSGDSATDGYRVQTYMVPSTVEPSSLTFGLTGPTSPGSGAAYRQPLYTSAGSSWVNRTTAVNTGLLIGLPVLSFAWVEGGAAYLPAGTYNMGYACTVGAASATQLDKYWNVRVTFAADATDTPAGITWAVEVVSNGTTSTTAAPTTSTTVDPGSTTTTTLVGGAATTSTTLGGGALTTTTVRFVSGAGSGSGSGNIVATGNSPLPIVIWAILLLVFGRMALLLARPLRVLPPDSR